MPRVSLTDEQRTEHLLDKLCRDVLDKIEYNFQIRKRMSKSETADALSISPNTWLNWRRDNLRGHVSFREVVRSLDRAGYRVTIEPKK